MTVINVYRNDYDGWETFTIVRRDAHSKNIVSYVVDPHPETEED